MSETLDIEQPGALQAWLRDAGHIGSDERVTVTLLTGGVSNRTVQVTRPDGQQWVVKQALEKLRVKVDWYSDPSRVHREAEGLRWLNRLVPSRVPTLVFEDTTHHLLGMSAVAQPHENWKTMLLQGALLPGHVTQFARLLSDIHSASRDHRDEVAEVFDDRAFFESLRLEPYYAYAAEQLDRDKFGRALLRDLIQATRQRRLTLVHGDFSPKNILVQQGDDTDRLILLDHEVIHFGDPAFDVGFALTHLLSKSHHFVGWRDAFADAARRFWRVYHHGLADAAWPVDLEPMAVRHTLACLLARVIGTNGRSNKASCWN